MIKWLLKFAISKEMLLTYGKVVFTGIAILVVAWYGLKLNSRPWSERTVPYVEGIMIDSAIQVLEEIDLVPVLYDSVFSHSAMKGSVCLQSPDSGSFVKSGRPVYLTTYKIIPPDESIGVKEGMEAKFAIKKLKGKRFDLTIKYEPNNELAGKVVRVEYNGITQREDKKLRSGSELTLIIGEEVDKQVRIPWLIGLNRADAEKRLSNSSLSVGFVEYGDSLFTRKDTLSALVESQFPASSAGYVKAGTAIDLFLEKP